MYDRRPDFFRNDDVPAGRRVDAKVKWFNTSKGFGFISLTDGTPDAFLPMAITPTYCATKAAIHSYSLSLRWQLKGTSTEVIELIPPYVQTHLMGSQQAADPNAVMAGVFEALVATAVGLCVAIPALISYRFLRGKVERIVVEMEKDAVRIADAIEATHPRERRSTDVVRS